MSPLKKIILSVGGLLFLGAGLWAIIGFGARGRAPGSSLPPELSVARLKSLDPEESRGAIKKAMERTELTDEQRRELMANRREARAQREQEQADAYYACQNPEERNRLLDQRIDEDERLRKQSEADYEQLTDEERIKQGEMKHDPPRGHKKTVQPGHTGGPDRRGADQRARRMAYHAALRARMRERGINPPK